MEKSLNEKIFIAHGLACELGDKIVDRLVKFSDEHVEMIFCHADGLAARRLYNIRDGRCSLAETMSFDPEAEEERLDKDIKTMEELKLL